MLKYLIVVITTVIHQYFCQSLELETLCNQELAGKELSALPRDAHVLRTTNRCVITSKPRGVVPGWRLSRIVWRAQADYNKLSGVTRAWW